MDKGKLRSVRIEVATNGYTVNKNYDSPPGKPMVYSEEKPMVFNDIEQLLAEVKTCLSGGHINKSDGKKKAIWREKANA